MAVLLHLVVVEVGCASVDDEEEEEGDVDISAGMVVR